MKERERERNAAHSCCDPRAIMLWRDVKQRRTQSGGGGGQRIRSLALSYSFLDIHPSI